MRAFALFRVRGASGTRGKTLPKNGFHAPAGQTLRRRIIKLCEKKDTAGGTYFLWMRRCGAHRTPTRGNESVVGDLHQEDSYYRMARAIDAKIDRSVVDDKAFDGMPP